MNRRSYLKKFVLGIGGIAVLPPLVFPKHNHSRRIMATSLLDFFYLYTSSISTRNLGYNQFCDMYGCNLNQYSLYGYQPQFNNYGIREKYYEFMWPTFRWTRELWSGANNVSMPVIDRHMNLNGHVGGPHLMGLGLIADAVKKRTNSSQKAADYTLPIDTFEDGSHSFLTSSYSDFDTEKGNIEIGYDYHGWGQGTIEAKITDWDMEETAEATFPIQFS